MSFSTVGYRFRTRETVDGETDYVLDCTWRVGGGGSIRERVCLVGEDEDGSDDVGSNAKNDDLALSIGMYMVLVLNIRVILGLSREAFRCRTKRHDEIDRIESFVVLVCFSLVVPTKRWEKMTTSATRL